MENYLTILNRFDKISERFFRDRYYKNSCWRIRVSTKVMNVLNKYFYNEFCKHKFYSGGRINKRNNTIVTAFGVFIPYVMDNKKVLTNKILGDNKMSKNDKNLNSSIDTSVSLGVLLDALIESTETRFNLIDSIMQKNPFKNRKLKTRWMLLGDILDILIATRKSIKQNIVKKQ